MRQLLVGVGPELRRFELDELSAELASPGAIRLPGAVQYAWPHAHLRLVFVACAERTPGRERYTLCTVSYERGLLALAGPPVALSSRPIHVTSDQDSQHVLVLFNSPPSTAVFEVSPSGAIVGQVQQSPTLRIGPYPHHIRVAPSNNTVIVAARGNAAGPNTPAVPGELNILEFRNGLLRNTYDLTTSHLTGMGTLQVRHLDFHPHLPLVYVTLEAQNALIALRFDDGRLQAREVTLVDTLTTPGASQPRQMAGAVHVHPSGRYVYVANRADAPEDGGTQGPRTPKWEVPAVLDVFAGGENSIAAFSLDSNTGEPRHLQSVSSGGISPRTFSIDPEGRILVAANMKPMRVRQEDRLAVRPASLTFFKISEGGSLTSMRSHPVDTGKATMEWCAIL